MPYFTTTEKHSTATVYTWERAHLSNRYLFVFLISICIIYLFVPSAFSAPRVIRFGTDPREYDFTDRRIYDLTPSYLINDSNRQDYQDARGLAHRVLETAPYLHPGALFRILCSVFENAAGHGSPNGQSSQIEWGMSRREQTVSVFILNESYRPLPLALRNVTLTGDDESFAVPDEQRDFERGGFGMGIPDMTHVLRFIYDRDLGTSRSAKMSWHEVRDEADRNHPEKVLFEMLISDPEPEAFVRQKIAREKRDKEERRKKAAENRLENTLKILSSGGSTNYQGLDFFRAKDRIVRGLNALFAAGSTGDPFFRSIFALTEAGPHAADTFDLLQAFFRDSRFAAAKSQLLAAISVVQGAPVGKIPPGEPAGGNFAGNKLDFYEQELESALQNNDPATFLLMLKPISELGEMAQRYSHILLRALDQDWEEVEYDIDKVLQNFELDNEDLNLLAQIVKKRIMAGSPNESSLYYPSRLVTKNALKLKKMKSDLFRGLQQKKTAYYSAEMLKSIGIDHLDVPALRAILQTDENSPGQEKSRYYTFQTIRLLGREGASLKADIYPFLEKEDSNFSASETLRALGLEWADFDFLQRAPHSVGGRNYQITRLLEQLGPPTKNCAGLD